MLSHRLLNFIKSNWIHTSLNFLSILSNFLASVGNCERMSPPMKMLSKYIHFRCTSSQTCVRNHSSIRVFIDHLKYNGRFCHHSHLILTSTVSLIRDRSFSHCCMVPRNGPTKRLPAMLCKFMASLSTFSRISSTAPRIEPRSWVPLK